MKQYSFLLEFHPGTLSTQIKVHYNRMRPYTRMSPQMFDQIEREARKKAAQEIKQFKLPSLKKREHKRQLQKFEKLMKGWSNRHNIHYD